MDHVRIDLVPRSAKLADQRAPEHSRPPDDGVLTDVADVAREVAVGDWIVERRRLDAVRVHVTEASEQLIAPRREVVIDAPVELIDVAVEKTVRDVVRVAERAGNACLGEFRLDVRQRVVILDRARDRIDTRRVDRLRGDVQAPARDERRRRERTRELDQVSLPHQRRRND
jgi:hypothetical protein